MRGEYLWAQDFTSLPFQPLRVYVVGGFPPHSQRGHHALRSTYQLITVMSGTCLFALDNGSTSSTFTLDKESYPLLVPPLVWRTYTGLQEGVSFFVLASTAFSHEDYIHSYEMFLKEVLDNSSALTE